MIKTIEIIKTPEKFPTEFIVPEELIKSLEKNYEEQTYDTGGVNTAPSHQLRIGRLPKRNIPK
jgi:hypothetical protein